MKPPCSALRPEVCMVFKLKCTIDNGLLHHSKCLSLAGFLGLFVSLFVSLPGVLQASPIPGTGSSRLTSQRLGLFFMAHGFHLTIPERLEAMPDEQPESANGELSLRLRLKNRPETSSILLTTDQLKPDIKFESYSHKWLKEYANYGFDINRTQKLNSEFSKGWLVDFFDRAKGQQVRQIIMNHDSKIAIITCADEAKNFDEVAQSCGRIFKDFSWIIRDPATK